MLNVSVISPEAMLFEGTSDEVVAPAFDGMLGILSGPHDRYGARMVWLAPLVVLLLLRREDHSQRVI